MYIIDSIARDIAMEVQIDSERIKRWSNNKYDLILTVTGKINFKQWKAFVAALYIQIEKHNLVPERCMITGCHIQD